MIYTIGNPKDYDKKKSPIKEKGGSVWLMREQAEKHCHLGFKVYGVEAKWFEDTVPSKDGTWNLLKEDKPLVKLKADSKK